jgi:secreted PhoX family phosphatase
MFDMCDNIVAAPWGDIVLCEDGSPDEFVRAVRPDGGVYPIARNAHVLQNELAGACFAPDGRTLFVSIQSPGITFAIRGPWESLRTA